MNPSLPFEAVLRGRRIQLRLLFEPNSQRCISLWGGPGLKDFTEQNPLPPQLLWKSCLEDTFAFKVPLEQTNGEAPIWALFSCSEQAYRFLGWQGWVYAAGLPSDSCTGWAWQDQDRNQRWDIHEPVWLPPYDLFHAAQDSFPPWQRFFVDTFPPASPKVQLLDSIWAVLFFQEEVFPKGEYVFPLSERVLLVRQGMSFAVQDSLGLERVIQVPFSSDTQGYGVNVFWPLDVNARTPLIVLRWTEELTCTDAFWAARSGDSLFAADACFESRQIWLSPLHLSTEVEAFLHKANGEVLRFRVPGRKYAVTLPTVSGVARWRVYGPSRLFSGTWVEALPEETIWLPAGDYAMIGLGVKEGAWHPVVIKEGRPYLIAPVASPLQRFRVGE